MGWPRVTEGRVFRPRVIPVLLLRDGALCKPVRFGRATYVGDPRVAVKILSEKGADEVVLLDASATARGGPDFALIEEIAGESFVPMAYGGGIRDPDTAARVLGLGVEKIVIGNAALDDVSVIAQIAAAAGSQAVAVCLDVKKGMFGGYSTYGNGGRRRAGGTPEAVAAKLQEAGVGEILVQSIDRDGMRQGYDTALIAVVARAVDVPVVALGGAGTLSHLRDAIDAGASAAAGSSLFVLNGPHRAVLITYPTHRQLDDLFS
jgi:cyclase